MKNKANVCAIWSYNAMQIAAISTVSSAAFAVDYMSPEQARRSLLPAAAAWVDQSYPMTATQLADMSKRAGLPARSAAWQVVHGLDAKGAYLGSVVVDNVIGKFELITYAVAIDTKGAVLGIEILSYRESHGGEVRLPAWRRQFVGKGLSDPIKTGEDIAILSGATMSCKSLTDGVRRITALLAVLRDSALLPT